MSLRIKFLQHSFAHALLSLQNFVTLEWGNLTAADKLGCFKMAVSNMFYILLTFLLYLLHIFLSVLTTVEANTKVC